MFLLNLKNKKSRMKGSIIQALSTDDKTVLDVDFNLNGKTIRNMNDSFSFTYDVSKVNVKFSSDFENYFKVNTYNDYPWISPIESISVTPINIIPENQNEGVSSSIIAGIVVGVVVENVVVAIITVLIIRKKNSEYFNNS
jgi:hypothetical protein